MTNVVRQRCTLAPTLLNRYASVVSECWLDRIRTKDGVGTLLIIKQDSLLFWKTTRYVNETIIYAVQSSGVRSWRTPQIYLHVCNYF